MDFSQYELDCRFDTGALHQAPASSKFEHTAAPMRREVERKLDHLMAKIAPAGSQM
jgi:hypothetical protein